MSLSSPDEIKAIQSTIANIVIPIDRSLAF